MSSPDSHIPIIPTNLGEHGNFINKCRDSTGKIDPDAKAALETSPIQNMKQKPTQEEKESAKYNGFSNISIAIVIFAFVTILLILAIVWLVLKYNNLKQERDEKEKKEKEEWEAKLNEKNKEIEEIVESARQNMHMLLHNHGQSMPNPIQMPVKQTTVEEVPDQTESPKSPENNKPSQEELENTLKKLSHDLENNKAELETQD